MDVWTGEFRQLLRQRVDERMREELCLHELETFTAAECRMRGICFGCKGELDGNTYGCKLCSNRLGTRIERRVA